MPRYYFHLRHERDVVDGEGVILPNFQCAMSEAVCAFGEMLQALDGSVKPGLPVKMTLADEAGNTLCRLCFAAEVPRMHG